MDDIKSLTEETGSKMSKNYQSEQQDKENSFPHATMTIFQVEKEHGYLKKQKNPKMTEAEGGRGRAVV